MAQTLPHHVQSIYVSYQIYVYSKFEVDVGITTFKFGVAVQYYYKWGNLMIEEKEKKRWKIEK